MFDKGLVYRGCKIMAYSNGCHTVLSNFEAGLNYQQTTDPSIFITFPLLEDKNVKLIAWTTTPWTLPTNLAIAVNPQIDYVYVQDFQTQDTYVLAEKNLHQIYNLKKKNQFKVLKKLKGEELRGKEYQSLFNYYENMRGRGCFRVLCADFVTQETGTGIVHCAPAHGHEDYKMCVE